MLVVHLLRELGRQGLLAGYSRGGFLVDDFGRPLDLGWFGLGQLSDEVHLFFDGNPNRLTPEHFRSFDFLLCDCLREVSD